MGIPMDVLHGAQNNAAYRENLKFQLHRQLQIFQSIGVVAIVLITASLTLGLCLGIWYDLEIAQALMIIILPEVVIFAANLRKANMLVRSTITLDTQIKSLKTHHFWIQVGGFFIILGVTVFTMVMQFSTGL